MWQSKAIHRGRDTKERKKRPGSQLPSRHIPNDWKASPQAGLFDRDLELASAKTKTT
jgi:hypothetical protein